MPEFVMEARTPYCVVCGKLRASDEGPNETSRCTPCYLTEKTREITKETCGWIDRFFFPGTPNYRKFRSTFILGRVYRKLSRAGFREHLLDIDIEQVIKDTLTIIDMQCS